MAVNSDLVYVGSPDRVTGSVMSAPKGTPLPSDASTAPNAAFVDSGYITEDGVTLADAQTWVDIKDWGGDTVRRIKSESQVTLTASFLEVNANSAKAAFSDDNVTVTGDSIAITFNVKEPERKSWIINMLDGDRYLRLVVPDGQVTDRADMTFTRQGAVTIPVTITAYPDDDVNTLYMYADAPGIGGAVKGSASPGDTFPAEPTVTASDSTNAAKLAGLGFVADPTTAWTTGQKITVGAFDFNWSGTAWAAGAHA